MAAAAMEFSVVINRKEVVVASLPLQEHRLPLSNLDLLLPPVDVGVFFCYKKPCRHNGQASVSMSRTLKNSLAQILVSFYAFAGEVVMSSVGEPELLCNNRGVDFIEAYADVELRELQLYNPDASVEGKLVPKKKVGVLCIQAARLLGTTNIFYFHCIQVTELRCGAVIVACTFDHRIADAYSGNMFLVAWAEMAQSKTISLHPSFRRSLLNPRRPASCEPSLDDLYVPLSTLPPPSSNGATAADPIMSRIYYVTAENIARLQALASSKGCRRSKLESLGAYLWQIVAKSETDCAKRCKMGVVVDGRMRLCDENNSMANYFGNVLSIPFGEERVEELVNKPLSWVADAIHKYVHVATNKEHFLGLIDWVEAHRPEPALAKIYCNGSEDGSAFVVSSGQRFPVGKVDFGWGRPVFGSYHFPWGGDSGYVMPMPSASREGDWVVYVYLLKGQIELLEEEAGDVFKPLTPSYLGLHGETPDFSNQTSLKAKDEEKIAMMLDLLL